MKTGHKILYILLIVLSVLLFQSFSSSTPYDLANTYFKKQSGVPISNCAQCHSDQAINNPNGDIQVQSDIPPSGWLADSTYNVALTVSMPSISKFGFKLMVWGDLDSCSIGTLLSRGNSTNDVEATESEAIPHNSGVAQYVLHLYNSTSTTNIGSKTWYFRWKAPSVFSPQNLYFNISAIAADADGTSTGDYVLLKQENIYNTYTSIKESEEAPDIIISPTVTSDMLHISGKSVGDIEYAYICHQDLKTVMHLPPARTDIDVSRLTPGSYYLICKMHQGDTRLKKFIKN